MRRPMRPPFRINHALPHLARFIRWVETQPGDTELVINGDFVDFLAEDDAGPAQAWTAREEDAIARLDQIVHRTSHVFDALRYFVQSGKRLTLLLGNHDPELSLPAVRHHLFGLLGRDVRFIYDGEAYRVGRVLIEHGNRYDRWNMLDFDGLRQERSLRSRGMPVPEEARADRFFTPPAGSRLVVDVMNHLKQRYRFIDLLKPETAAVLPLLLALEPDLWPTLDRLVRSPGLFAQYARDGLAAPGTPKQARHLAQQRRGQTLVDELERTVGAAAARPFIDEAGAVALLASGDVPLGQRAGAAGGERRGPAWGAMARSAAALLRMRVAALPERRLHQLHTALRALGEQDCSFDLERESPTYLDAARATAAGGFDVVVYGHTHLPKQIRLDSALYLNTGTWCDVMRMPPEIGLPYEAAGPALRRFVEALRTNDYRAYVCRYLTYARIAVDPQGHAPVTEAALHSYCGPGREASPPLTPLASGDGDA